MTDQEFQEYVHESFHQLMDLNNQYRLEFNIGSYVRWDMTWKRPPLLFPTKAFRP
jgi:hypothetical protein